MTHEALQERLTAYLDIRKALGSSAERDAKVLANFVKFAGDAGETSPVTSRTVFDWLDSSKLSGGGTLARRLSAVRQFLLHLSASVPETQVPELRLIAGYRRQTPFVFTSEEIASLLKCASEFETSDFGATVLYTVLGLIVATGLRASEALGLDRSDVMPRSNPDALLIRETKFYKTRIVPLHPSTAEQLRMYAGRRALRGYDQHTNAFFVSGCHGRLSYDTLRTCFQGILAKAGIRARDGCNPPTLHSIRHTFVVSRLTQWHRQGINVQSRLAHLATYLGHVDVTGTYWYMTATPELLSVAASSFEPPAITGGEQ
jgi:integrase